MAKLRISIKSDGGFHEIIIFEKDVPFLGIKQGDEFIVEYFNSEFTFPFIVGTPYFLAPIGKKIMFFTPPDNSEDLYFKMHKEGHDNLFLLGGIYRKNISV